MILVQGISLYFYCMKQPVKPLIKLRQSYQHSLQTKTSPNPKLLNTALLTNPYLKDQQHYRLLTTQITNYNKRVTSHLITDPFEVRCFQQLFVLVSDLANMQSRADAMQELQATLGWWNEQGRIIKQRKELGVIKYKTDKLVERARDYMELMNKSQIVSESVILPSQMRYQEIMPYQMDYRSKHKEYQVPQKRLKEFKRKVIHIDSGFNDQEVIVKKEKVTYPMPKKVEIADDNIDEKVEGLDGAASTMPVDINNLENAAATVNNPQGTAPAEGQVDPNAPAEDPNQQDLGMGLGQQPEAQQQGNNQDDTPVEDKLAPKYKIYTASNNSKEQQQSYPRYNRPYMFYSAIDDSIERRMEQRVVYQQQYSLQLQREQKEFIKKAHEWAGEKSKIDKELQMKLESMANRLNYRLSAEDPEKKEMIAIADQKKYGFYIPLKMVNKSQVLLDDKLPEIKQFRPIEKEIRRDRLASLKHKFADVLQLRENSEARDVAASMCQTSPRRRNFSMILEEHSLEKEKSRELDEIQRIKESLGKQRININIRTLAQALVPDTPTEFPGLFQSPPKQLPSNPFIIEVKKKKKKK